MTQTITDWLDGYTTSVPDGLYLIRWEMETPRSSAVYRRILAVDLMGPESRYGSRPLFAHVTLVEGNGDNDGDVAVLVSATNPDNPLDRDSYHALAAQSEALKRWFTNPANASRINDELDRGAVS